MVMVLTCQHEQFFFNRPDLVSSSIWISMLGKGEHNAGGDVCLPAIIGEYYMKRNKEKVEAKNIFRRVVGKHVS